MFKHNWAWIKLATDNFSTVLTRNRRNPRDYAPLSESEKQVFSRDFRLSLAKRPEKLLVKTRAVVICWWKSKKQKLGEYSGPS